MAFYHVLLNGTGTSGDGSTWDDLSDATSAYIGQAGFASITQSAVAGDIIFVKGVESSATTTTLGPASGTLALSRNPIRVYGCKSATTNEGGAIVTSDLIPGLRTGDTDEAWNDADIPTLGITGLGDITIRAGLYFYGIKFSTDDNLTVAVNYGSLDFEECHLEVTGSTDLLQIIQNDHGLTFTNSNIVIASGAGFSLRGLVEVRGGRISVAGTTGVFGNLGSSTIGSDVQVYGVDFSNGAETTIFNLQSGVIRARLYNCLFPTSWALSGGTATHPYRLECYGCDDTTGLSTSEQQMNIETHCGTVTTETTKVRTGGATDGAAGAFSWDMTSFTNTALGIEGLKSPWITLWVEGDGTSKTVTVYFTSDSANTNSADWNDDEVWMEYEYPDDAGTSRFDNDTTVANLLATASAVTDDTGSSWPAGTQNNQLFSVSLSPDYEGYVRFRVVFAPGTNAETIYVDPHPKVS